MCCGLPRTAPGKSAARVPRQARTNYRCSDQGLAGFACRTSTAPDSRRSKQPVPPPGKRLSRCRGDRFRLPSAKRKTRWRRLGERRQRVSRGGSRLARRRFFGGIRKAQLGGKALLTEPSCPILRRCSVRDRVKRRFNPALEKEHAVPVAVEPISLSYRFTIRLHHQLPPCESAHEHDERTLRKMEIRQQTACHPEAVGGVDENIVFSLV